MKTIHFTELSPEELQSITDARQRLVAYWNALSICEESGGTSWGVLEDYRQRVTDCLAADTPEAVSQAERLTAEAEYLRQCGGIF